MPGICGSNLLGNIDKMMQALQVNARLDVKNIYQDDKNIEIGLVALCENKFTTYTKGDLVIFLDGFVYNIDENNVNFQLNCDIFHEQLVSAYHGNFLPELLKNTDGYFIAVIYDKAKKKIFLISDRLGTRFVYWYHKDSIFAFAGEIKGLLAVKEINKTIDNKSIECFLNSEPSFYLFWNNTFFKHIKLINPATIMEYDISTNILTQQYYWTFSDIQKQQISYDDAVDKLHNLVEKAVLKRIKNIPVDDMALPLSGGLDSRLLFAILNNHNKMPSFIYTNGDKHCTDVKYARLLCKKYHYKHFRNVPNTQNDYVESGKKSTLICDGMVPFIEYGTFNTFPKHYLVNGFLGDAIFGESFKTKRELLDCHMDAKMAEHFYGKFKELSNYGDNYFNIDKLEPCLLMNRVRRYTTQMINGDAQINEQILPYIDKDIIDFVYSIPDAYRYKNYLYSDMLLKYYPEYFKNIPWNRYNRPIQGKINKNNKHNLNAVIESIEECNWIGNKLKKSVLKRINYHTWFSKKTYHVFQKELTDDSNIKQIKSKYYLKNSVIKDYVSNTTWNSIGNYINSKNAWKIALFLTVEFYLRNLRNNKII